MFDSDSDSTQQMVNDGCFLIYGRGDITLPTTYLKQISDQAVVSHLENRSLRVLVDSNDNLNRKIENEEDQ